MELLRIQFLHEDEQLYQELETSLGIKNHNYEDLADVSNTAIINVDFKDRIKVLGSHEEKGNRGLQENRSYITKSSQKHAWSAL